MDKLIIEFNKKFDKQKQELIDGFKALGEEKRLPKALATIEGEQPTYKDYFKAGWQSRQAEVDQLNEVLDERTKEWLEAIKLGTYFQEAAKPLKDKVDQLQSQINEMAEVGLSQESAIREKDKRIETVLNLLEYPTAEWSETVFLAIQALRGEYE